MSSELARFCVSRAQWSLSFSPTVIEALEGHRQKRWYQHESVGQLFSKDLTQPNINVHSATLLKALRSGRFGVTLDPESAERERTQLLEAGLHCVGLWHTHPERNPTPSSIDGRLAADHALAARPVLNGLCFVIVGTAGFPAGWYIGVHDGERFHQTMLQK